MADPAPSIHPQFNASDADVIIESADGVQFHLHRKYLEAYTGAFPGPAVAGLGCIIQQDIARLTESEKSLQIVFQFVYPKRHPDLAGIDFDTLSGVAEAVEKYEVFAAMVICEIRLKEFITKHPLEILLHAMKHGRTDLVNEAALHLSRDRRPLDQLVTKLPSNAMIPWLRYYNLWKTFFENQREEFYTDSHSYICTPCLNRHIARITIWEEIDTYSVLLQEISATTETPLISQKLAEKSCKASKCPSRINKEGGNLLDEIKKIPPFTDFLDGKK